MRWSSRRSRLTPEECVRSDTGLSEDDDDGDDREAGGSESDPSSSGNRSREVSERPPRIDNQVKVFTKFSILNQRSEEWQQLARRMDSGLKKVTQDLSSGFDRLATMLATRNTPRHASQARREPTWEAKITSNPLRRSFSQNKKAVRKY